jgi:PIN domain
MTLVLDACAIIAYLRDEEGAEVVEAALISDNDCVVHAVNLCEVYYDCVRRDGAARADTLLDDLVSISLVPVKIWTCLVILPSVPRTRCRADRPRHHRPRLRLWTRKAYVSPATVSSVFLNSRHGSKLLPRSILLFPPMAHTSYTTCTIGIGTMGKAGIVRGYDIGQR